MNVKKLIKEELKNVLKEKWSGDVKISDKHKGEWDGWSESQLKSEAEKLRNKETRTEEESRKLKAINFALRAKQGWSGKIK